MGNVIKLRKEQNKRVTVYSFEVRNLKQNCNPMFDVNVKILSDLKKFITVVAGDRELFRKFCDCDRDFTRTRKLPFERLGLLINRLCKKTMSIELEKFFEEMQCPMNCSVSAFTQHRLN